MSLCPDHAGSSDRIPASSLAQVLWEILFVGASPIYPSLNLASVALLVPSYFLHPSSNPPWYSFWLSCLWTGCLGD